jgi:hypothetical protein
LNPDGVLERNGVKTASKKKYYNPSLNDDNSGLSTGIGSSKDNPLLNNGGEGYYMDEFDSSMMVVAKKTVSRPKVVAGLEGYDEDDLEDNDLFSEINEDDEINSSRKNSRLDILDIAAKVDLFDGRLE